MGGLKGQMLLDIQQELLVDNFCGGGGASEGIYMALGRDVDVAINHCEQAIRMHEMNHPQTRHERADIFEVDPDDVTEGRPVGLVWLSPDCRHFSRAKSGKPREKKIRSLPWVTLKWGGKKKPRVICVENVVELQSWSRLVAMRDRATGRVLRKDGSVAPAGERTPLQEQLLGADKKRSGSHFRRLVLLLQGMGYHVEHRELTASDYGVPTTRKRVFLIARRDGRPIVWPTVTHGHPGSLKVQAKKLKAWRTAAECIDFGIQCASIFLTREDGRIMGVRRPLADGTMDRVGKGALRHVVQADKLFVVKGASGLRHRTLHGQSEEARQGVIVAALMVKHFGGVVGFGLHGEAMHTVTAKDHHALVLVELSPVEFGEQQNDAEDCAQNEVRALLERCAGKNLQGDPTQVKHRGQMYRITDIGMRMLKARELYNAMGFPQDYVIGDDESKGLSMTAEAQVRMVGNSVPPPLVKAIVQANCQEMAIRKAA
jgi:DNA (cytosine-5)-methyltransferase 1